MPIIVVQPLGPTPQISTRGGWTCTQLIELADRRTERRGSKVLDLNSEFLLALQELCLENRWSWRRSSTQLTTTAGLWQYDLADPANADAADIHQFMQHGVKVYPNPGQPAQYAEVTPLFEQELQDAAIFSATNYPTLNQGQPQQYFMMPGDFLTLCLTPVPDQTYPMGIGYWAVPNLTSDALPQAIPLLPAYMHHVLLKKLEAQIFRFTLGEGAAKYQAAAGEYKSLVEKYQNSSAFVPGERNDYGLDDTDQTSIQSTS